MHNNNILIEEHNNNNDCDNTMSYVCAHNIAVDNFMNKYYGYMIEMVMLICVHVQHVLNYNNN